MSTEIGLWLDEVLAGGFHVFAKVLAGNDTMANESHQLGIYIPNRVFTELFPQTAASTEPNPRTTLLARIDSHGVEKDVNAIWYRPKKNECRITNWGGSKSPVMDPEATGSVCILAFKEDGKNSPFVRVWLCRDIEEEDIARGALGEIEPGIPAFLHASQYQLELAAVAERDSPCTISEADMPPEWKFDFPPPAELVRRSIANMRTAKHDGPDQRLLRRRDCEFELFKCVESIVTLPRVREGFDTVDLFFQFANRVTNRRRTRSGASLELQTKAIFDEEGVRYAHGQVSEQNKRPDFLFPSVEAYQSDEYPADKLRLLAAKTTAKDRWRQILEEADRIPTKHLLTLQRGISRKQFDQMTKAKVVLVVPEALHESYRADIRPSLLTLQSFIQAVRHLA